MAWHVTCQVIPPPVFKQFPIAGGVEQRGLLGGSPVVVVGQRGHVVNPQGSAGQQVATQLTEIDGGQRLMAEAIGTLLTGRLFTINGATAPRRASAYWASSWA